MQQMPGVEKLRIVNRTLEATGRGYILDPGEKFGNVTIMHGHYLLIDANPKALPAPFDVWADKGLISVKSAADGTEYNSAPVGGEITRAGLNPFSEAQSRDMDEDNLFAEPDLSEAREAFIPGQFQPGVTPGSHQPETAQGARISFGLETSKVQSDTSPIPGDRPRSVDNTDEFTVRAPQRRS